MAGHIVSAVVLSAVCVSSVLGHSWLACTDYAEKNADYYDHDKCRGYARLANQLAPYQGTFGQDRGYNYHPSESKPCRDARNDATSYDSNHPMAVYYPGQQVVLAHPMKNHGSDTCTNPFIPDGGNHIYRSTKNAGSDPTLSDFRKNLVADLGIKDQNMPLGVYPRPGYQNAPKFCENTDKSLGTYSFNVPNDLEPGQYTFIWLWGFNGPQDLYSGCFEVKIVGSLAERNAQLQANGYSDTYEPCGGKTSNFEINGNTNPGCSDGGSTTTTTQSSTTTTTTPTTQTTTTEPVGGGTNLDVKAEQVAGVIDLPTAPVGTTRRHIKVKWDSCQAVMKFWPARVVSAVSSAQNVEYDLVQEGSDVNEGKIYYHAGFGNACNILIYPPMASLTLDEN